MLLSGEGMKWIEWIHERRASNEMFICGEHVNEVTKPMRSWDLSKFKYSNEIREIEYAFRVSCRRRASCVLHNNDHLITSNRKHFRLSIDRTIVSFVGKMRAVRIGWHYKKKTHKIQQQQQKTQWWWSHFYIMHCNENEKYEYKNLKSLFHFNGGLVPWHQVR